MWYYTCEKVRNLHQLEEKKPCCNMSKNLTIPCKGNFKMSKNQQDNELES